MTIRELIAELEKAKTTYGDLPLGTWDGLIDRADFSPGVNGTAPEGEEKANEVYIEFHAE